MGLNCYFTYCFACKTRESQAFANGSQQHQKNSVLACFRDLTIHLFAFAIKTSDDKQALGTQGSAGALIQSHTKQWIAIMWKVNLESREWRTNAGAGLSSPHCAGGSWPSVPDMNIQHACPPGISVLYAPWAWLKVAFQHQLGLSLSGLKSNIDS